VKQLDELRAASAALEPERTLAALTRLMETWCDPAAPWCARLAQAHGGFSPAMIERGLRDSLRGWSRTALEELRARELHPRSAAPRLTCVWLAGSIPPASFSALLLPLLVGSAVYAKPASADPVTPALVAASLREIDPEIGAALALGDDLEALARADAVVAAGSDETVRALRERVPPATPFVAHAHKLSVAAIGPAIDVESAARRAAFDAVLWDGRGCLSPAWVLAAAGPSQRGPRGRAAALAECIADELDRFSSLLPQGPLLPFEHARLREQRAAAAVRPGVLLHTPGDATAWTVVLDPGPGRPAPGALRHVPVVAVDGVEAVARFCAELRPHLSALGHAGFGLDRRPLERALALGAGSRLCPLGRMQLPPIDWRHDGQEPLGALLRWIDVEPE
jgi:hypothetical protein